MNIIKRLFNKLNNSGLCSYVDEAKADNGCLYVKGWAFNKYVPYIKAEIVLESGADTVRFNMPLTERIDVYNVYNEENAKHSGFELAATYESAENVHIFFEGTHHKGVDRFELTCGGAYGKAPALKASKTVAGYADYCDFKANKVLKAPEEVPQSLYDHDFDVIIPIYNGFEFFDNLFKTVEKTNLRYQLIIVNDCSTDERVLPYLSEYALAHDNVVLVDNKENLGFVQSVNKALSLSVNNVALVNSDVILPDKWLERLMLPIINDSSVASVTPFTTCGTICSFPNFCQDNPIFLDLGVDSIDAVFSRFVPSYTTVPTGVGFCMGMSRQAINRVGMLDAETFYKGYGEENDWCQRAIKLGYKNIHIENLFVYHKHGGSFLSEDKKRYIERNLKLLNEMHPNYSSDVQKYCNADPVRPYREYAKLCMLSKQTDKNIIMFDHVWGGGANSYSRRRIENAQKAGYGVLKVVQDNDGIYAEYYFEGFCAGFAINSTDDLDCLVADIGSFEKIIINELVSFKDIYPMLDYITALKAKLKAQLIMLGHDFYSICPSLYLMDNNWHHCFKTDVEKCRTCIADNENSYSHNFENIDKWREKWGSFLAQCDEVTVFSENSKGYFLHWYPDLKNLVVLPHTVEYIEKIPPYPTDKNKVVVGILGNFMRTKGSRVVLEMQKIIKQDNLNMEIVVVGQNHDATAQIDDELKITGRYKPEDIPQIFAENKIDIVFIASIWPETFSYTTQEVINMGLPVAAFDIGAPAERIKKYEKGLIISQMTAECAVKSILEYIKK